VEAHERPAERGARAMLSGMAEGLRYSREKPEVRAVLIAAMFHFTFGMVYMQVFAPLFAVDVLDIGRGGLGLMLAFTGAGALVAALSIARRPPRRIGLILPLCVCGLGVGLIAFSASTYLPGSLALVLSFGLIMVVGAFQTTFMSLSRTLLVQAAPAELRGRVLSLISLDRAVMAGGAAAGGFVAAATGVQVAQMLFGAICVAGGLFVLWWTPDLRRFGMASVSEAPKRVEATAREQERAQTIA
jgi:MFS-type transporter involved in bile tolerance (Atg22 family)